VISCVLLLGTYAGVCDRAEQHARATFDVRLVLRNSRADRRLRRPLPSADLLLNFLSAPYVDPNELAKFTTAINFHPAPPEYPGVGSASLALYDRRSTHGVTAHVMTERYDAGRILRVRRFPIAKGSTYASLFARALDECLQLFVDVTDRLARGLDLECDERWARAAYTRREFEAHPAFREIS
jgi:folate-dependent phosphoribosylglycinamide formyltransferase PurN